MKKDFSAIEKEAARNDQLRQEAKATELSKEEQQQSVCILSLDVLISLYGYV